MAMKERYYTVDGQMIGYKNVGGRKDFLTDALGSVTAEVDQTGSSKTFDGRYKPYGGNLSSTGTRGKYGWIGCWGYRDTSLNFATHYVRARHYSRTSGVWTTIDPLWPSEDAFIYIYSNPVRNVDPSGKLPIKTGKEILDCANKLIKQHAKCSYDTDFDDSDGELSCVEVWSKCSGLVLGDFPTVCPNHKKRGPDCPRSIPDVCAQLTKRGLWHAPPGTPKGQPCKSGDMVCFHLDKYAANQPCGGHCGVVSQTDKNGFPTKVVMCSQFCHPKDTVCEVDVKDWITGCKKEYGNCFLQGCGGAS